MSYRIFNISNLPKKADPKRNAERPASKDLVLIEKEFNQGWFPANPNILKEIRQKIRNKSYRTTKELLLETRRDSALFTYLLRTAVRKGKESSLDALLDTNLNKLESSIPSVVTQVSKYDLTKILEHQVRNLQQMIITTVAVQTLALSKGINPDHAYLTAVLRMLGLTLTAWNYQHTYTRVLKQTDDDYTDLDTKLSNKVSFSPMEVVLSLTRRWGLPNDISRAVYQRNDFRVNDELTATFDSHYKEVDKEATDSLIEICRVAEGLAVATVSKCGAKTDTLWHWASNEVLTIAGEDSIKHICSSVNSLWQDYSPLFSGWYDEIFSEDGKIDKTVSDFGKKYFTQNTAIFQCTVEIQQAFVEIYKRMTDVNTAESGFHMLVSDLLPASGFMEGGIYIADQTTMQVSPLMMLGRAAKEGFRPAYLRSRNLDLDPLIKSLMSGTIVKGRVQFENREVMYITGAMGAPPNQLIVYLETSFAPYLSGEIDATSCFRAVQQCIVDSIMNT